jgi:hypothetical protein
MDRKMNNQNKLKVAAAVMGIAVLFAAVAVPTALALRDEAVVTPDVIIDPDAQALFAAGELNVNAEAQGQIEPLFIDGEPIDVFDGEVKVLPGGSVSISNPNVDPMPIPGQPPEDVLPIDGIIIGESIPPQVPPVVEGQESGASSGSVGAAIGPVVVNPSDVPDAPPPEPGVVHVVPIGSFLNDVQVD